MHCGRNRYRTFWRPLIVAIGVCVFATSCASTKKAPVQGPEPFLGPLPPPSPMGPPESYGPPAPTGDQAAVANPESIVLILGPGMAPGFSCVGALKAIHEAKIPIRAIYANEVCALAAGLFLTQPTLNRMDWALMQFTEDMLRPTGSALSLGTPEKRLEKKLVEVFGSKTHEELKIPLRIPLTRPESGEIAVFEKGRLAETIRAALSTDGGLRPGSVESVNWKSVERPKYAYPVAEAWKREGHPIVVVGSGTIPSSPDPALPVVIVNVKLNGIAAQDFKKRNQAAFQGKSALQQAKQDILGKIGRTE